MVICMCIKGNFLYSVLINIYFKIAVIVFILIYLLNQFVNGILIIN